MSTEKMREDFLTWWWHEDRLELRQSCAEGWGIYIWSASRTAIEVDLPSVSDYFDKSEYPHTCDLLECDLRISIGYHGMKVKP